MALERLEDFKILINNYLAGCLGHCSKYLYNYIYYFSNSDSETEQQGTESLNIYLSPWTWPWLGDIIVGYLSD